VLSENKSFLWHRGERERGLDRGERLYWGDFQSGQRGLQGGNMLGLRGLLLGGTEEKVIDYRKRQRVNLLVQF